MSEPALGNDARLATLLAQMRETIEQSARTHGVDSVRTAQILDEVAPFAEAMHRAWMAVEQPDAESLFREVRSYVWLLAYRLGDQHVAPAVCASVLPAWCAASGQPHGHPWSMVLQGLIVDGYAQGREDSLRTATQRELGDTLGVFDVGDGVVIASLSTSLGADAARRVVERIGQTALRTDARMVLLDVSGLRALDDAVATEILSVHVSLGMLGARAVLVGVSAASREIFLRCEHGATTTMVETMREGLQEARSVSEANVFKRWWKQWRRREETKR